MRKFLIAPVSPTIDVDLKKKIDAKTKPPGSLGRLVKLATVSYTHLTLPTTPNV